MTAMRSQLDRWLMRHTPPDKATSTKDEQRAFFASMPEAVEREWNLRKAKKEAEAPEYGMATANRAAKRMARVDAMPADLRAVVYEYGLEIVQEFINCGLKTPSRIKHLIDTVRMSDFENGQKRFKINKGPNSKRNPAEFDDEYYTAR